MQARPLLDELELWLRNRLLTLSTQSETTKAINYMRRFHRPGEEKRSLVIVPTDEYDNWLHCTDLEVERSFPRLFPTELMATVPSPKFK